MSDFDAIIIGSGFGGAITACRLAEAGYKVLVLERGRRWDPTSFPREPADPFLWDNNAPVKNHGWFDLRMWKNMSVIQGAGVGGGSLVYANISIKAKKETFDKGWPAEVTFADLAEPYALVGKMLNVRPVPEGQWPERTKLMKEAAGKMGWADRFEPLELAVSFDDDWNYSLPNPHSHTRSKEFTNPQGRKQGTCVHLGYCDIGCDVNARNTLDLNYLAAAEAKGADVRPLHLVTVIEPQSDGYKVQFNRIEPPNLVPGSATARIVILGAGSLGSTELLLRARDEHKTLPNLSAKLGHGWSSNGDFLTPAIHPRRSVNATAGPTITCAINLLDGTVDGQDIFIEDGGLPDIVDGALWRLSQSNDTSEFVKLVIQSLRPLLTANNLAEHVMPWFAQARDAADGVFSLKKGPDGKLKFDLHWDIKKSKRTMDAVVSTHQRLALATEGMPLTPFTWTILQDLITPHPLGGCNMGSTAADGVVGHNGEVFGYKNLYVADGAIVPKAIGLNPSRTIGALAERIAKIIVTEAR